MPRQPAARTRAQREGEDYQAMKDAHASQTLSAARQAALGSEVVSDSAQTTTKGSSASQLETHLLLSIRAAGLPEPVREHRFHPQRRWRIDLCWPLHMLAVECEGGIYRGGGHSSVAGLKRDIEKSNALTLGGWRLLRFHGDQIRSGEATELIKQALGEKHG